MNEKLTTEEEFGTFILQLELQKNYTEALKYSNEYLEKHPESLRILSHRGFIHYQLGNYRECFSDFEIVWDKDPNEYAATWFNKAQIGILSEDICATLLSQKELGFSQDPNEPNAFYAEKIPNKVWLYYGKADTEGGPYFGFWADKNIEHTPRKILADCLLNKKLDNFTDGMIYDNDLMLYREVDFQEPYVIQQCVDDVVASIRLLDKTTELVKPFFNTKGAGTLKKIPASQ